jgi:hypothetical protein
MTYEGSAEFIAVWVLMAASALLSTWVSRGITVRAAMRDGVRISGQGDPPRSAGKCHKPARGAWPLTAPACLPPLGRIAGPRRRGRAIPARRTCQAASRAG